MSHEPIILNGKKVAEDLGFALKVRADELKQEGESPHLYIVNNPYDPEDEDGREDRDHHRVYLIPRRIQVRC